jgi:hypothetical protein
MVVRMPRDLPPDVAQAFVRDMHAYFAEENRHKRDEIALRQLQVLREHLEPSKQTLGLSDVKAMFMHMRNHTMYPGSRRGH